MIETTLQPHDYIGHVPDSPEHDPDHEKWAAYWRTAREDALRALSDAFDSVGADFDAGDLRAGVDIVMFYADENHGGMGIVHAIQNLLAAHYRSHLLLPDLRAGVSLTDSVELANWVVKP